MEESKLYQICQDNEWMPVLASPAFLGHLSQCDTAISSGHGWSLQETRTLCCTHVGSWAQITDHAARQLCRQGSGSPGGQQGAPPLPSTGKAASGERCPVLPMQERDRMERVQVKATEMTKGSELFSHEKRLWKSFLTYQPEDKVWEDLFNGYKFLTGSEEDRGRLSSIVLSSRTRRIAHKIPSETSVLLCV